MQEFVSTNVPSQILEIIAKNQHEANFILDLVCKGPEKYRRGGDCIGTFGIFAKQKKL